MGITNVLTAGATSPGFHSFTYSFPSTDRFFGSQTLPGPVPEIAVDEDGEWYGVSNHSLVLHFAAKSEALVDEMQVVTAVGDIAVANRTLYAALSYAGSGGVASMGIHRIPRANVAPSYSGTAIVPNVTPSTLAAAGTDLYFIEGTKLSRVDLSAASAPVDLATVGAGATALTVDAECIYWVEGGTKIMKRARR